MFFAVYYSKKLQLYNRPRGMPPKRPPWQKHHTPNPENIEISTSKWACKTTYIPPTPARISTKNRPHCQSERCPDCFSLSTGNSVLLGIATTKLCSKKNILHAIKLQRAYTTNFDYTTLYILRGTGEEIRNSVDYRGKDRPPDGEQQHVSQRRECREMFTTSSPTTNHVRM